MEAFSPAPNPCLLMSPVRILVVSAEVISVVAGLLMGGISAIITLILMKRGCAIGRATDLRFTGRELES